MKKIFFVSLMLLALGGASYAQASPVKSNTRQKKEAVKPASSVSSVAPVNTNNNKAASTKTKIKTQAKAKPATQSSNQTVQASAIRKHKKPRHAVKKPK